MSCREYRDLLISQVCGEIEKEQELQLQQHLDSCVECKQEQTEFRAMVGLIRQIPDRDWNEELRIRDLLRRKQRWTKLLLSKAAIWLITLTALFAILSSLPLHWQLTPNEFSVRWGNGSSSDSQAVEELKRLQSQLAAIQAKNEKFYQNSELRLKQLVDQKNIEQEKRYWQTLQLFNNYMQLQRKADLQKIQRDIASTYDQTGLEVAKTNELLEYVLRASATDPSLYEEN